MFLCGPSRLVWFAFGSVATWAWIHHQRHHRHRHHHHDHQQGMGDTCPPRVGYTGRAQWEQQQQRDHDQSHPNNASSSPSHARGDYIGQPTQPQPQQPQPQSPTLMDREDYERLRQMGRSAEETVSAR